MDQDQPTRRRERRGLNRQSLVVEDWLDGVSAPPSPSAGLAAYRVNAWLCGPHWLVLRSLGWKAAAGTAPPDRARPLGRDAGSDPGRHRNATKDRCEHGHRFDAANTYYTPTGERRCRICRRAVDRAANGAAGRPGNSLGWPRSCAASGARAVAPVTELLTRHASRARPWHTGPEATAPVRAGIGSLWSKGGRVHPQPRTLRSSRPSATCPTCA